MTGKIPPPPGPPPPGLQSRTVANGWDWPPPRVERNFVSQDQEKLRQEALKKLSPEEITALGLSGHLDR